MFKYKLLILIVFGLAGTSCIQQDSAIPQRSGDLIESDENENGDKSEDQKDSSDLSFSDINIFVERTCGGGSCHGEDSGIPFANNEENFNNSAQKVKNRILEDDHYFDSDALSKTEYSQLGDYIDYLLDEEESDDDSEETDGLDSVKRTASTKGDKIVSFDDINIVMIRGCSGSTCHGAGSNYGEFVNNESNVKDRKAAFYTRVVDPNGNMATYGRLTEEEVKMFQHYLDVI